MSVHQDYPENVPSAKHGTADSLAAPGRVGAGGTIKPAPGCGTEGTFFDYLNRRKADLTVELQTADAFDRIVICGLLERFEEAAVLYSAFLEQGA